MKPNAVIGKIPPDYLTVFGDACLTDAGAEKFDELIDKRLPDDIAWCGDELLAPYDYLDTKGLSKSDIKAMIDRIIDAAYEEMCQLDGSEYFEDWEDED